MAAAATGVLMTVCLQHRIAGIELWDAGCRLVMPKGTDVVFVAEAPKAIFNDVLGQYWHNAKCLADWARDQYLDLRKPLSGVPPSEVPQVSQDRIAAFEALETVARAGLNGSPT